MWMENTFNLWKSSSKGIVTECRQFLLRIFSSSFYKFTTKPFLLKFAIEKGGWNSRSKVETNFCVFFHWKFRCFYFRLGDRDWTRSFGCWCKPVCWTQDLRYPSEIAPVNAWRYYGHCCSNNSESETRNHHEISIWDDSLSAQSCVFWCFCRILTTFGCFHIMIVTSKGSLFRGWTSLSRGQTVGILPTKIWFEIKTLKFYPTQSWTSLDCSHTLARVGRMFMLRLRVMLLTTDNSTNCHIRTRPHKNAGNGFESTACSPPTPPHPSPNGSSSTYAKPILYPTFIDDQLRVDLPLFFSALALTTAMAIFKLKLL